jgi:hypothetical protein
MGLRETINKKPGAGLAIGAALLVVGVLVVVLQLRAGGPPALPTQAFFTTDDGATYFTAGLENLPPFQRDGKEAVRAYVFECNGKRFVNHLERFTPEARKAMEAAGVHDAVSLAKAASAQAKGPMWGKQVKKPGAGAQWVAADDMGRSAPIMAARCPDGPGQPMPVNP